MSTPLPRRSFLQTATLAAGTAALAPAAWTAARAGEEPGRRLGIALVGLGSLAGKQIAPALAATRHCRLAGLVSGDPAKARAWATQYGVPEKSVYSYETFDRIADNPDIDLVYIVLPNSMHAEYSIRAAKAGKHVLCEKPMAVSAAECRQMIAASRAANRRLAVAYRLQFEPFNREVTRLAREKTFGDLRLIEAGFGFRIGDPKQWRLRRALAGGGALMDVGVYAIQAARYVSGQEPLAVSASEVKTDPVKFAEVDESIQWTMRFPGGVLANCTTSYATGLNRLWAGMDKGWCELSPAYSYHGLAGRRSDKQPMTLPDIDQFAAEMDDFALCVKEGRESRVSGEEGLRDMLVVEAIYRSIASGRVEKVG